MGMAEGRIDETYDDRTKALEVSAEFG